jgi:hypothetical protein
MGEAFDRTCMSLDQFGTSVTVRETIARWFIEAAINGERDFSRLYVQAHEAFGVIDFSMPLVSVGRDPPSKPMLRSRTQRDHKEPRPMQPIPQRIEAGYFLYATPHRRLMEPRDDALKPEASRSLEH